MTALSRSRIVTLCATALAPIAIAVACAQTPANPNGGNGNNGGTGSTSCGAGQLLCGGLCATTASDPLNCGTCGNVCPVAAPYCSNSACAATCAAGLLLCGSSCVSTATDPSNCGECGRACAVGQSCAGGVCSCPAGQVPCNGGCAATCGTGGTAGTGAGGSAGVTTGGAGGAGATAGAGMAGSGGMAPVMKDCATKVTVTMPTFTNFESYTGMMPAYGTGSWIFQIGTAYAGLYVLSERIDATTLLPPSTYTLSLTGGHTSNFAAHAANTATTDWGGGMGFWMGCIDAHTYSGLTFWARGTTPSGMVNVSLAMEDTSAPSSANPAGGGTCDPAPTAPTTCAGPSYTFAIAPDWTQVTIPWALFTGGVGAGGVAVAATGDEITGLSFVAGVSYVPNPVDGGLPAYVPEPGSFDLQVDDIGFAP